MPPGAPWPTCACGPAATWCPCNRRRKRRNPCRAIPCTCSSLRGTLEPGTYLLVAYGGPPLPWADGAADLPFHVRAGALPALADGWVAGTIGPMGSEVFAPPPRANRFRLDLPASAVAGLDVDGQMDAIAQNSREPHAVVTTGSERAVVEVTGAAGQPYALRAQEAASANRLYGPGRFWVSAAMTGAGAEEVPPTVLLVAQGLTDPGRILASTAPLIAPGTPWRTSFNVRGRTTLLLNKSAPGELSVSGAGEGLGLLRAPPRTGAMPDGVLAYTLTPNPGRQGVVDLVFSDGPGPAAALAAAPRWPADPVIPLGEHVLGDHDSLQLYSNAAPGLGAGLLWRPSPVALAEGPLVASQMPGAPLSIPLRVAPGGSLQVWDPAAGIVQASFTPDASGTGTLVLPAPAAAAHPRPVPARAGPAASSHPGAAAPRRAGRTRPGPPALPRPERWRQPRLRPDGAGGRALPRRDYGPDAHHRRP